MMWLAAVGAGFMFAAIFMWAWFALSWLKTGAWPTYTAIDGACWVLTCDPYSWAYWPQDWIGIHKALMWFSPAGALFMIGVGAVWLAILADESRT